MQQHSHPSARVFSISRATRRSLAHWLTSSLAHWLTLSKTSRLVRTYLSPAHSCQYNNTLTQSIHASAFVSIRFEIQFSRARHVRRRWFGRFGSSSTTVRPNHKAISRSASCSTALAWMAFFCLSVPNLARMVFGGCAYSSRQRATPRHTMPHNATMRTLLAGSVVPMRSRTSGTASMPSQIMTTTGPEMKYFSRSGNHDLLACSA